MFLRRAKNQRKLVTKRSLFLLQRKLPSLLLKQQPRRRPQVRWTNQRLLFRQQRALSQLPELLQREPPLSHQISNKRLIKWWPLLKARTRNNQALLPPSHRWQLLDLQAKFARPPLRSQRVWLQRVQQPLQQRSLKMWNQQAKVRRNLLNPVPHLLWASLLLSALHLPLRQQAKKAGSQAANESPPGQPPRCFQKRKMLELLFQAKPLHPKSLRRSEHDHLRPELKKGRRRKWEQKRHPRMSSYHDKILNK